MYLLTYSFWNPYRIPDRQHKLPLLQLQNEHSKYLLFSKHREWSSRTKAVYISVYFYFTAKINPFALTKIK